MKITKFFPVSREKYETLERTSNFYKCQRDVLKEEVADLISKKNKNEIIMGDIVPRLKKLKSVVEAITLLDFSGYMERQKED